MWKQLLCLDFSHTFFFKFIPFLRSDNTLFDLVKSSHILYRSLIEDINKSYLKEIGIWKQFNFKKIVSKSSKSMKYNKSAI